MASARIFLFTHKKLKDGSHPIVLQIIKDRKRKLISIGHSATLQQWDEEENKPNKKHPNHKTLVLLLQKKIHQANRIIMELDEAEESYSIEDIIFKLKTGKTNISVFKYTDGLINKLEKTGKIGNSIVYSTALSALKNSEMILT